MATFEVISLEGSQFVKATLRDESIRAEAGALCYYQGSIKMRSPIPSPLGMIRASLSDESFFRPSYTGTGEVYLESSLGGFHVLDLENEAWILERSAYWASDASVVLTYHREPMLTSLWAGEGLLDFQTKVKGTGRVVLNCNGPVEILTLRDGESLHCDGRFVVARTSTVKFKIRRPTGSRLGAYFSGEGTIRTYIGPGKLALCSTPYWRLRMSKTEI